MDDFFEKHGINALGTTFIYFPSNAYEIRNELKAAGFRYSDPFFWHAPAIIKGYEDKIIEVKFSDYGEMMSWGEGFFKPTAKEDIRKMLKSLNPSPVVSVNSEWVGTPKQKITTTAAVVYKRTFETPYGYTLLLKFEDADGNILQWFTTTFPEAEIGDKFTISAAIKSHDEYNGVKATTITRAKLTPYENN